jgi:hypothetical protein
MQMRSTLHYQVYQGSLLEMPYQVFRAGDACAYRQGAEDKGNAELSASKTKDERRTTMKPNEVSYDEIMERQAEAELFSEDEQTYISACLSETPGEEVSEGWYNGKPADLVSIFRRRDNRREYLDE